MHCGLIADRSENPAIPHANRAPSVASSFLVMRDHEDGLAEPLVQIGQQSKDSLGVLTIEVPGRLIGEQDRGPIHKCPRNCNALLLATGERTGFVLHSICNSQDIQDLLKLRCELRSSVPYELHDPYVVFRGQRRQEIVFLEYESDRVPA
jgi:hypothetical protein